MKNVLILNELLHIILQTQHTLFEVAISLCSSLDDVIRGTLQRGSYVSLFWKKDIFPLKILHKHTKLLHTVNFTGSHSVGTDLHVEKKKKRNKTKRKTTNIKRRYSTSFLSAKPSNQGESCNLYSGLSIVSATTFRRFTQISKCTERILLILCKY